MMKRVVILLVATVGLLCAAACGTGNCCNRTDTKEADPAPSVKKHPLLMSDKHEMVLGTYASPPRLSNGRVDFTKLLDQLEDLNANTYNWLIWRNENDWDDLQLFLPLARAKKIAVWVTVVPPSESKPIAKWNSEPFGLDYVRWAEELGKLSAKYPNLVAFSIDDFVHNLKTYTPEYTAKMVAALKKGNPNMHFIPCCYYRQLTPDFAKKYEPYLDGILFPYRAESEGANLQNATLVEQEIANVRKLFKSAMPIYIDVYLTAHSRLGASTAEYVQETVKRGKKAADGVLIYTHPNPDKEPKKYIVVKHEFNKK
ncbi:MAG TPA: hypothetical protein GXZ56_10850 [Bacteroidales bacterium]|nr:hypothetical protein [Bacteroidales bacterium]